MWKESNVTKCISVIDQMGRSSFGLFISMLVTFPARQVRENKLRLVLLKVQVWMLVGSATLSSST